MNYRIQNPIDLDLIVDELQVHVYNSLVTAWQGTINGHGRTQKVTQENKAPKLQFYTSNGEYKDVYYNDKASAVFFFMENGKHTSTDGFTFVAPMKAVFMVNLFDIFTDTVNRRDTEAQRDVVLALRSYELLDIGKLDLDFESILQGYDTSSLKAVNIGRKHCFAVEFKVSYFINEKC